MKDLRGILYREVILYWRQPYSAVLSFLTPLLYFFLFGIGMARSGMLTDYNYLAFFIPGYAMMSVFTVGSSVMQGVFNDRLGGMLTEMFSAPVKMEAYVYAKVLFASAVSTGQTLILLAVGIVFTTHSAERLLKALIILPVVFVAALLVAGLIGCVVAFTDTIRSFITAFNLLSPILTFASSMFYPIERLPTVLRVVALANPLTWATESVRQVLDGSFDPKGFLLLLSGALVFVIAAQQLIHKKLRVV